MVSGAWPGPDAGSGPDNHALDLSGGQVVGVFPGLPVMSSHLRLIVAGVLAFVISCSLFRRASAADSSLPPDKLISGETQLFVDDHLISRQIDLTRTLHANDQVTKLGEATLAADSLVQKVVFDGNRSLRDLAPEGMAQLRFTVGRGGRLYLFTIDAGPGAVSTGN